MSRRVVLSLVAWLHPDAPFLDIQTSFAHGHSLRLTLLRMPLPRIIIYSGV